MRPVCGVAAALLISFSPSARATEAELTWLDAAGTPQWSASLSGSKSKAAPSPLVVGPWRPRLPPLALEPLADDPGSIDLSPDGLRNKVVVLDFWASWCAPCARTLPWLDELWRTERERGLVVIAVNVGESAETARHFADSLGLGLPLARVIDPGDIETLPTVLLVDRDGRVRLRLDGYRTGSESSLAETARELLAGKPEPTRVLAQVVTGDGALEARFSREVPGSVQGLTVHGSGPTILATTGWDLFS